MNVLPVIASSSFCIIFFTVKNIARNRKIQFFSNLFAWLCLGLHACFVSETANNYTLKQTVCYILLLFAQVAFCIFIVKIVRRYQV